MRPALLCALLASCGDPLVRIDIDQGAFEGAPITLRLITPAPTDPTTCDDIAFDAGALASAIALTERQVLLGEEPLSIEDLDRQSARLLLAEVSASDGQQAGIGCAELSRGIDSDETIALRLEPVSAGTVVSGAPIEAELDGAPGEPIVVSVTDRSGAPLPDVEVRWSVAGTDGAATSGVGRSGPDGQAELSLSLPRAVGPIAVAIRPRFAFTNPSPISGFVGIAPRPHAIEPGPLTLGRFGPSGELRLVRARGADLVRCSEESFDRCVPLASLSFSPGRLQALEETEEDGADGLLAIGANAWSIVHPSGAIDARPTPPPAQVGNVFAAGPCGGTEILLTQDDTGITEFPRQAPPTGDPFGPGIILLASGCVSTSSGEPARTYAVFQVDQRVPILTGDRTAPWLGPPTAFAFAFDKGSRQRALMGVQLELSQPVVTRSIWGGGGELTAVAVDPLPSPPQSLRSGDFDGDGVLDLAAILVPPSSSNGRCGCDCALWISLGGGLAGARSLSSICDPTLVSGDLDGDGRDEVILLDSGPNATVLRFGVTRD